MNTPTLPPPHEKPVMQRLRVRLIDALVRAADAQKEAFDIAIELLALGDGPESENPPNVQRDTEKTGPRTPFRTDTPPPGTLRPFSRRPTAYAHQAVTDARIVDHLIAAHKSAATEEERAKITKQLRDLVDQGVIQAPNIEQLLAELKNP